MKKLGKFNLASLANDEIKKQELVKIKGGQDQVEMSEAIYLFKCSCRRFTTVRVVNSRKDH